MKVNLPPLEEKIKRHYLEDGLAYRLETRMFEKGLSSVGSSDSWKKRVNDKGEERLGSLDMSREARAYRTLDVRNLSPEELVIVHRHELSRMTRFVIGPMEMRIILKKSNVPNQTFLQPHQVEYLIKENDKNRPALTRKSLDLFVPPYFYYDHDFDGMRYHHAWDICVWKAVIELPRATSKKGNAVNTIDD